MGGLLTTHAGLLAISALLCLAASPVSAQPYKYKPEIFDVTSYGATGDCSTPDTPAIQAAIDAAYVAGGGKVYLPRGCYRLDGAPAGAPQSFTIYGSNITFAGDGDATVLSVQKWGTIFTTTITDPITHHPCWLQRRHSGVYPDLRSARADQQRAARALPLRRTVHLFRRWWLQQQFAP
jgi:Pectate lyase superfamily protein